VPSSLAAPIIAQLREFGETRRGWLGVRIQSLDDTTAEALGLGSTRGALVAGIDDKGPAKPGGVETGDVILKFDGKDVKAASDLSLIVAGTPVDKEVDVLISRKGKELTKRIKVGRLEDGEKQLASARKDEDAEPQKPVTKKALGLDLSSVSDDLRKRFSLKAETKGVVVTGVDPDSPAADKRIQPGEVLLEVGQEPVANPADVMKRVDALKKQGKKSALLFLENPRGERRFVALAIE